MGYTSIYEAGNIRYQESHCTDYDSYGENDPIQSFFGKHDSGWGVFRLNIPWPFVPLRECPFGTIITGFPTDAVPNIKHSSELRISWIDRGKRHSDYLHWD